VVASRRTYRCQLPAQQEAQGQTTCQESDGASNVCAIKESCLNVNCCVADLFVIKHDVSAGGRPAGEEVIFQIIADKARNFFQNK
jgi:hypothetical protein